MTDSETVLERRIPLAGAANFRDLGGYPTQDGRRVRWRRLFRSDRLAELSPADVDVLRELGITTVFDLRTADELDRHGTSPLYEHGVIHRHVPFVEKVGNTAGAEATEGRPSEQRRADMYIEQMERAHAAIREVFTSLAEPHHYPAVFHCAAGKDRTGMTAALLLHALGVDDEVIAQDYALTAQFVQYTDERIEALAKEYGMTFTREQLGAEPETIVVLFRTLEERHGSVLGFLAECGVTGAQLEALRAELLEG